MHHPNRHAPRARFIAALAAALFLPAAAGQTFLIDLGPLNLGAPATTPSPDINGNTWNNFSPGQFARLADTSGTYSGSSAPEGIGLGATTPVAQSASASEGLQNPSPILLGDLAIETATQDFFYLLSFGSDSLGLELSWLDPSLTYNLRFFASRNNGQAGAITRYTVTGGNGTQSDTLGTTNNVAGIAEITGVTPRAGNTILIEMTPEAGSFMFLSVLELSVAQGTPTITFTNHPADSIADAGGVLTMNAGYTASEPGETLAWERDGVPLTDDARITGSATTTLTITGAVPSDAGEYRLVVTIGGTAASSEPAIAAVRGMPANAADINGDGVRDFFDMLEFLGLYEEAVP